MSAPTPGALRAAAIIAALPAGARVIRLCAPRDGDLIVHPSTREADRWQLSWFGLDGQPAGHSTFDSRDDALASALGCAGRWGPPHGTGAYTVEESL